MKLAVAVTLIILAAAAFAISWLSGFLVRALARRLGWMDKPGGRKHHPQPIPTGGGVAVWLGVVLPMGGAFGLAFLLESPWGSALPGVAVLRGVLPAEIRIHVPGFLSEGFRLWTMLAGGILLGCVGLWDDRVGLDWRLRLVIQFVVAAIMVALGWRASLFLSGVLLPSLISIVWIVALINAFNMLDNMDGLAAGVAGIAAVMLAAVMFLTPRPESGEPQLFIGGFLLVLAGALLGFLMHNWPRARLFMGDAGSYFIGFVMGLMTLAATFTGNSYPPHSVLAPLCVLAIPIYDMATVIMIRLRAGRSPFEGDRSHLSHRLVELGLTPLQAVLTIWLATGTCGLGALLLHQVDTAGALIILFIVVANLALVRILEAAGRRSHKD